MTEINTVLKKIEQNAENKGIDLQSPLTKKIVLIWCKTQLKEAFNEGDFNYAYNLLVFNNWVQNY